jgi:hypothetical protein
VKLDKFHSSKVQNQEGEDQGGDQRILALSTTFVGWLFPQNISRGKRRCRTDQEEKVFHEYAGGPWRTDEGRQKGGRQQEEASRPNEQFWQPGSEPESKIVTRNGRKFDLKYRFEDKHGDCGGHGGRLGHFREGKRTKEETGAATAVSQQMDEKAADGNHQQEQLKKQLKECSRKRRQELATAKNVDGGTSCRGATASRRASGPHNENRDDWQAELLHDVDEDTFMKLDNMASDIDKMATRERWIYCRSCKGWPMVPCSRTSSKFIMLSILGLLLQQNP